jgi:sugar phosphate isomerase/epimerase
VPPPVAGYPVGWCIRARTNAFAEARWAGFEFVELAMQDVLGLSDEDFGRLSGDLQARGLRVLSGYNPIPRELKVVGPEADAVKLDQHLDHLLSRAAALKLSYVIFNSGAAWRVPEGVSAEDGFKQLAAFSRRFAEAAGRRGITVLIEPLRSTDSNQITTIAEALKLVGAVDHPNFQMMVDYSFLMIQKDDLRALLGAAKHLRHVHLANPAANRTYPMDGSESDYAVFFSVLKQMNYRGGLSVHAGTQAFTNDAPRAIRFLRQQARTLAGE